ncbi:ATP-binding protein [Dehalogenimonas etheniformans]|nr:ATP-binding protein [Dehalogenimonas etheniformans]QNT76982.1 DUF1638 domain-containing protein [Dehalogenimonas etheniformans]
MDKSVLANDSTIIIYGTCHPDLNRVGADYYGNNVYKIPGNNCFEIMLGEDKYLEYANSESWFLDVSFIKRWKKEMERGFGANSANGNVLQISGIKQIDVFNYDNSEFDEDIIRDFSKSFGMPYNYIKGNTDVFSAALSTAFEHVCINGATNRGPIIQLKNNTVPIILLENMNDAIYSIDPKKMKVSFISPIIKNIMGISPQEFANSFLSKYSEKYYFDIDRDKIIDERNDFINDSIARGFHRPMEKEYRVVNEKGQMQWIREMLCPQFTSSGEIEAFIGKIEDITQRKNIEQSLEDALKKESSLRLELEQQIQNRNDFTRALVHELKTPLTPIIAASDVLVVGIKNKSFLKLAQNINTGAENLNRRIDELLELARGEVGILGIRKQSFDWVEMTSNVLQYIEPQAKKKNIAVSFECAEIAGLLMADKERIRQVLLNLLDNAIKYTPEKGRITLKCETIEDKVIFKIIDSGSVIPEAERASLFKPYHRLERDRDKLNGLGLGLALSKMIVELHNGNIWFETVQGQGNIFAVSIPLNELLSDEVLTVRRKTFDELTYS